MITWTKNNSGGTISLVANKYTKKAIGFSLLVTFSIATALRAYGGDGVQAKKETLKPVMSFREQERVHSFGVDSSEKLKLISPPRYEEKVLQELLREPERVHSFEIDSSEKPKPITLPPRDEGKVLQYLLRDDIAPNSRRKLENEHSVAVHGSVCRLRSKMLKDPPPSKFTKDNAPFLPHKHVAQSSSKPNHRPRSSSG